MPRRKKKVPHSAIKPGEVRNPNGRPRGSANQINEQVREAFAMLLAGSADRLQEWMDRAAEKDPIKALDIFTRISERFVPSLQRVDHNIEGSQIMVPIQINLPSIPQVTVGRGASTENSMLPSPGEDPIALPEPNPTFVLPKFELSPNILRDIEETGGGAPAPEDDFNESQTGS